MREDLVLGFGKQLGDGGLLSMLSYLFWWEMDKE